MEHSKLSSDIFDKHARLYQQKYSHLAIYNKTYDRFCELLTKKGARVLDAACGPGHVARYLLQRRPDFQLVGIDLAPIMIELAREAAPAGKFAVHDCRNLADLGAFDGIICAFGFPYLSREDVAQCIADAANVLTSGGVFYLSTMEGDHEQSGFQTTSTGDKVYINYHSEAHLVSALEKQGFSIADKRRIPSPGSAPNNTEDLFVIAVKG